MTAEIAVMNKSAVALAADSTVTVMDTKTYNTTNKLFSLSKNQAVGIMIYGNTELGGVPWETIIKLYRNHIGENEKNYLEDYVAEFILFIKTEMQEKFEFEFHDELNEEKSLIESIYANQFLNELRNEIDNAVKRYIEENESIKDEQIKIILERYINDGYELSKQQDKLSFVTDKLISKLKEKFHSRICKIASELFENHSISNKSLDKIVDTVINLFCSHCFDDSGFVFAGFGAKEIFPCLAHYKTECIVGKELKFAKELSHKISNNLPESSAFITPFAQADTAALFMNGVSEKLINAIQENLERLILRYTEAVKTQLNDLSIPIEQANTILSNLINIKDELTVNLFENIQITMQQEHINPVMKAVAVLPKSEIAEVAESLVSITSFQQKVSLDQETVGGAIDVAVISKVDGFVWIKRKHYFKPELNPRFMSRYYNND